MISRFFKIICFQIHNLFRYGVGIYFEANGHGTAVFNDAALAALDGALASRPPGSDAAAALGELKALTLAINPAVGGCYKCVFVLLPKISATRCSMETE